MTLVELLTYVKEDYVRKSTGIKAGSVESRLNGALMLAKLSEETGELTNAALALGGYQRQEKVDAATPEALGDEVVDVIISALLVAADHDIDVEVALERKIRKLRARNR